MVRSLVPYLKDLTSPPPLAAAIVRDKPAFLRSSLLVLTLLLLIFGNGAAGVATAHASGDDENDFPWESIAATLDASETSGTEMSFGSNDLWGGFADGDLVASGAISGEKTLTAARAEQYANHADIVSGVLFVEDGRIKNANGYTIYGHYSINKEKLNSNGAGLTSSSRYSYTDYHGEEVGILNSHSPQASFQKQQCGWWFECQNSQVTITVQGPGCIEFIPVALLTHGSERVVVRGSISYFVNEQGEIVYDGMCSGGSTQ